MSAHPRWNLAILDPSKDVTSPPRTSERPLQTRHTPPNRVKSLRNPSTIAAPAKPHYATTTTNVKNPNNPLPPQTPCAQGETTWAHRGQDAEQGWIP